MENGPIRLKKLVESATTAGRPELDEDELKKIKAICR